MDWNQILDWVNAVPEPVVSGLFAIVVAVVGGFIAYRQATAKAADDIKRLERDQNLSVRREATLFTFKKKYELFERLSSDFVGMINIAVQLFPVLERMPTEREQIIELRKELLQGAADAHNAAQATLRGAYPFLTEDTFRAGIELLTTVHRHITAFGMFRIENEMRYESLDFKDEAKFYEENSKLYERLDEFLALLRDQIDVLSLSVTEGRDVHNKYL